MYSSKDLLFGIKGSFKIVKCKNCKLVFTNPRPMETEIKNYYPKEYNSFNKITPKKTGTLKDRLRKALLEEYYDYPSKKKSLARKTLLFPVFVVFELLIKRPLFFPYKGKGNVLEIGCGSGHFLWYLQSMGWKPFGLEINRKPYKNAKKLVGSNIFVGTLHKANEF